MELSTYNLLEIVILKTNLDNKTRMREQTSFLRHYCLFSTESMQEL